MKTGYATYWVPQSGADMVTLKAQHNRTFPGNLLAVIEDQNSTRFVKVAVMDGERPPSGSTTTKPVQKLLKGVV